MSGPLARVRSWWRLRRDASEHDAEVAFHLEQLAARYEAQGVTPEEARRRAHIDFGSRVAASEAAREAHGGAVLDDAWRDLRHAARHLSRHSGFTAAVVITLSLAIGAATAVFSVADHVLLRASPFRDGGRLVVVWETDRNSGTTREPAALPDWKDLQRQSRTLREVEALMGQVATLAPPQGEAVRLGAVLVSPGWLPMLGIAPIRGRPFTPSEGAPGGGRVALISEGLWRSRFGARADILESPIRLNEVTTQVIGVLPDEADYGLDQLHARAAYHASYDPAGRVDVWLPLQATEAELSRDTHPLLIAGRLAPGADAPAAQQELQGIMGDLERRFPRSNRGRGTFVESLDDVIQGPSRPLLITLLVAVALLALVATVNVTGLLLVRGVARTREVALRTALGAHAGRLARQFAVESALLVSLGALGGVGVAWISVRLVRGMGPADLPRLPDVAVDARSIAVAVILAGIVGGLFSLLPAAWVAREDPATALKGSASTASLGPTGVAIQRALVTVQLALCVALAVGATLVGRSFRAAASVDPGFRAAHVVKLQYELPPTRYPVDYARFPNLPEIQQFGERLLREARSVPGVAAVALASSHPLDEGFTNSWRVVGREAEGANWPEISVRLVSQGYMSTMGLRLRSGRDFGDADGPRDPPVALINAVTAERFFGTRDPIGQQLSFWGIPRRIIGVVDDERIHGVDRPAPPAVYAPWSQAPGPGGVLLARSERDAEAVLAELKGVVASIDPQLAVYGAEPFARTLRATLGQRAFATWIMTAFAVLTVMLALVGVHGVVAHDVARRTRELGIRLALGARPPALTALMVRDTARLAVVGVALGTAAALAGSGLLAQLLFGISRHDAATFIGAPVAVSLVALMAATWPARRAVRRAPLAALRGTD